MDSGAGSGRVVGDYILGRRLGAGSFSTVWQARHRFQGTEVAVKEIALERLSEKLRENLLSEVSILRRISHANIIKLIDYVAASGSIYLVLEYCSGGDLSVYIQKHGRVLEATAKHFMRQLATGLQVLRENNVIHRDLKPQNLLLSTYDDNAALKIADFGFARSLQPYGLAETLCGSPLYMAPEVMQNQKYDVKADLWSVGVILYQLVTGRTPFSGNCQTQLLQNIVKANVIRFPSNHNLSHDCMDLCQKLLRRSAVERLSFEEFFNHPFLSEQPEVAIPRLISSISGLSVGSIEGRPCKTSSSEDCLPFPLDDESTGQAVEPYFTASRSSTKSRYGLSAGTEFQKNPLCNISRSIDNNPGYNSSNKLECIGYRHDSSRHPDENTKEMGFANNQRPASASSKDGDVVDSLELVDQEYVLVPGPPLDMSSSLVSASRPCNSPCKSESSELVSPNSSALSAPMPIIGAAVNKTTIAIGSLESHSSPASGTSHGSMDLGGVVEQPSSNFMTRIRSLQKAAAALNELVKDKVGSGRQLEAFSIQLVVLSIWKQALHLCHGYHASGIEEKTPREGMAAGNFDGTSMGDSASCIDSELPDAICSYVEKEFVLGVGHAEELSINIGRMETSVMPDAVESIFQSALSLGRYGAVDEMMGRTGRASTRYKIAVCLLDFLLVEAPSLALNPPVSLTNSDRYRLRMYIDLISKQAKSITFSENRHQGLPDSSR